MTVMSTKSTLIVIWKRTQKYQIIPQTRKCLLQKTIDIQKIPGQHKTWQNIWWIQLHQLNLTKIQIFYLPVQVNPLPVYPVLQAQVKDPSVLVHVALLWQLSVRRAHSLLSENKHRNIKSFLNGKMFTTENHRHSKIRDNIKHDKIFYEYSYIN